MQCLWSKNDYNNNDNYNENENRKNERNISYERIEDIRIKEIVCRDRIRLI